MKVLVTSSRTPFALAVIRKLADGGHEVHASDSYEVAPGSHSRYVADHYVTAAPSADPESFVGDVARIAGERQIDLVVPTFEEVFYLAALADRLSGVTRVCAASFPALARVHDKGSFQRFVQGLGLRTPETVVARSGEELRAAIERFPRYFARAAFSRGGVDLMTNTGPLAGQVSPDDVEPTPDSPWLAQEFVDGPMICTYSTVHEGRVTSHCTYRAPRQWEHSTGIQFLSVDGAPSLEVAERIARELSYTGQLSFDFVDSPDGLQLIECNPRTTDGVLLMSTEQLIGGLLEPGPQTAMVEPGQMIELDYAVVGEVFKDGLKSIPGGIRDLVHVPDAGQGWRDHVPTLYSFLAFARNEALSLQERKKVLEAWADDISWDGEPIPGMSSEDAAALAEVKQV